MDRAANCSELESILLTTTSDNIEVLAEISLKAHDMAADALARGAEGESALCDAISLKPSTRGQGVSRTSGA